NAKFLIGDGNFSHIVLTTAGGPLRVSDFSGELALQEGKFSLSDARLSFASGVYKVSGTASLTGALDLKMSTETASGYNITGTLINPRVSRILTPATQVALKP